ncbi:MAG: NUDIX hydrolase [Dokdonella sp.]
MKSDPPLLNSTAPANPDDWYEADVWCPHVTVATVVPRDGKFLLIEEEVRGQLVLNQPAGHLDPQESLHDAAVRETLEESGWDVQLTSLLGVQQWTSLRTGLQFVRFSFVAEPLRHHPQRALDNGIVRSLWLTRDEIVAEQARLRSPLILHSIDQWLSGHTLPLDTIQWLASDHSAA